MVPSAATLLDRHLAPPADAAPRAPIVAVGQAPAQAAPRVTAVTPLLQNLASESSSRIEQLVSAHPASIAKLLVSPPAANGPRR